jgi:fumarate reductase subunit C
VNARRVEAWLWVTQRATAALLALFVLVHLVTIIYAVRGGLGAAEILSRVHSNLAWPVFYSLFVFAAAVHGAIGLRTVAGEWLGWRGHGADTTVAVIAVALIATGWRAVAAVSL